MSDNSPTNVTTTTSPPDWAVNQATGNIDIANQLATRGLSSLPLMSPVVGLSDQQNQAGTQLQNLAGNPNPAFSSATTAGQGLTTYQAPGIPAGSVPTINAPTADLSTINPSSVPTVSTGSLANADLSGYLNPFTQDVVNTTQNELNYQNQLALQNIDSQADTQGAYGGGRQGAAEANTNTGYAMTAANTIAGLNQANYANAENQYQADQARQLQADLANQGTALSIANANAGYGNQNAMFNAGNNLTAQEQNAGNALNIGAINNNASLGAAGINLGAVNALTNTGTNQNAAQLADTSALNNYGAGIQNLWQQNENIDYQNALNQYNQPINNLAIRQAALTGTPTGQTTTQPVYQNPAANALGLGIGAVGLGNQLFGTSGQGLLNGVNLLGLKL